MLPRCRGRFSPAHRWGDCSQPRGEISEIGPISRHFPAWHPRCSCRSGPRESRDDDPRSLHYHGSDEMLKLIAMGLTSVLGLGLAGLFQEPPPPPGGGPPPPKAKGKKGAPGDELRKTYDLLRRVRSDTGSGRTEERIKDWTDRATDLYRRAIRTREQGDLAARPRDRHRGSRPGPCRRPCPQRSSTRPTGPGPAPSSRRLRSRRHR